MNKMEEGTKPLPDELICESCKTRDFKEFQNIYYIPKGGNLPEGWVIWCKSCQDVFGAALNRCPGCEECHTGFRPVERDEK